MYVEAVMLFVERID